MRVLGFKRSTFGWALALLAALPLGGAAQLRTVVSHEIGTSGQEAALSLDFKDDVSLTIALREGQVLVDGMDVRDWNLEVLRRNISIIEQDVFLFSRSIVDNINFGMQFAH